VSSRQSILSWAKCGAKPNPLLKDSTPVSSRSLAKEVRYIQKRAAQCDSRIVTIGPLVLFSTQSGDAWILDPADQLATRLAQGGDPLAIYIEETNTNYSIGWQGRYRIHADIFVYEDNQSSSMRSITGYPIQLLLRMIAQVQRQ
jgi:hypothetical protein